MGDTMPKATVINLTKDNCALVIDTDGNPQLYLPTDVVDGEEDVPLNVQLVALFAWLTTQGEIVESLMATMVDAINADDEEGEQHE